MILIDLQFHLMSFHQAFFLPITEVNAFSTFWADFESPVLSFLNQLNAIYYNNIPSKLFLFEEIILTSTRDPGEMFSLSCTLEKHSV